MTSQQIEDLRVQIDDLNTELLGLIARRLDVSSQIGSLKQAAGLPLYSEQRERDLLDRFRTAAEELSVDPDYVEELMSVVLVHSRAAQRRTLRDASGGSSS